MGNTINVTELSKQDDILFIWLYKPFKIENIKKTIEKMKKLGAEYAISDRILIYKIIEFLKSKKQEPDTIINILKSIDLLYLVSDNKIKKMINEIKPKKETFTQEIIKEISLIQQIYSKKSILTHRGYPLPDPERGRPQLEWNECYYKECHQEFDDPCKLVDHLKQLGKYTQGLHVYHEKIVQELGLTPETIINYQMVKCPSYICSESTKIFTPESLCEHFKILGIPPFWERGMIMNNEYGEIQEGREISKIDFCIVCDSNRSCVLFSPCHHCVTCFNCYDRVNKCPYCNENIEFVLPY